MFHTFSVRRNRFVVLLALCMLFALALPLSADQADPNSATPLLQTAPIASNTGGAAAPSAVTERASVAGILAPTAFTGITDPTLITPSTTYDFSGDAEYSNPATFPGGTFSGTGEVRVTGSSWGTWNPNVAGIHVLYATTGSYEIIFNELQTGVGAVAEPERFGIYEITIEAFDAGGASLGRFTRAIQGNAGAAFLGLLSDAANIKRVVLSSEAAAGGFAFTDLTYGGVPVGGRLFGWLFIDADENGWRDVGEDEGLPLVLVQLRTGDGALVQETYSTVPRGWYEFNGIGAGNYCLRIAVPEGYVTTTPSETCFTFDGVGLNVNFGLTKAEAVIGDTVFADANANGVQDAGEMGYAGVTLALWSEAAGAPGAVIATTITDADGTYHFTVTPGTYFVQVTDTANVLAGLSLTAGMNPAGPITVALNQEYLDADFGYGFACPANRSVLSGRVWEDLNGDSLLDAGDAGIAGVQVCAQPLSQIYAARCTTTGADGMYRMCVRPMSYLVAPVVDAASPVHGLMPINKAFRLPVGIKPGMQVTDINFGFTRFTPVQ